MVFQKMVSNMTFKVQFRNELGEYVVIWQKTIIIKHSFFLRKKGKYLFDSFILKESKNFCNVFTNKNELMNVSKRFTLLGKVENENLK